MEEALDAARELAELRAEVARLRSLTRSASSANVRAALQFAEINDLRRLESEARERELERALREARDAALKKDEFLAKVSHELRTPLNGIIGMTTLLLDSRLEEDQRGYAQAALHAGKALAELIEDLLDLSKLEAAQLKLVSIEFDFWQVVEEVARMLGTRAKEDVEVRIAIDPGLARCFVGDPYRLRQVISNLMGNAIKFTERGHVTIAVRGEETDFGMTRLCVNVEDTGSGIPSGSLPLLFESFRQLDDSPQRRHGGTGLGLAISKALVERMGGRITAESELGKGSVFAFSLPLPAALDQPAPERAVGRRALAATRNGHHAVELRRHIEALGAELELESDLPRFLARLRDEQHDALILDAVAYGEEGIRHALANLPAEPRLAVIAPGPQLAGTVARPRMTLLRHPLAPSELRAFLLDRPLHAEHSLRLEDAKQRLAAVIGGREVSALVVEDNRINQIVARKMLERLGLAVEVAPDGLAALDALAARDFDIAFMDCQMPGMDGYETTLRIRDSEAGGSTRLPIVALTAQALDVDRRRCVEAGMDDYLAKPIEVDELVELLCVWLADEERRKPRML
jgi:signal transduction histidine kinase/CheY-like chemotaxis protein